MEEQASRDMKQAQERQLLLEKMDLMLRQSQEAPSKEDKVGPNYEVLIVKIDQIVRQQHEVLCEKLATSYCKPSVTSGCVGKPKQRDGASSLLAESARGSAGDKSRSTDSVEARSQTAHLFALQAAKALQAQNKAMAHQGSTTKLGSYGMRVRQLVTGAKFEFAMCAAIVLHIVMLAVHFQFKGNHTAHLLGFGPDSSSFAEAPFDVAERVFNAAYFVELLLRIHAFRRVFFESAFDVVDALVIILTFAETFIISPLTDRQGGVSFSVLRVVRTFRIFRFLRLARYTHHMSEMRLLVRVLLFSFRGVAWSVVLIMAIIMTGAILMAQITIEVMNDESIGLDRRRWMYDFFGTTTQGLHGILLKIALSSTKIRETNRQLSDNVSTRIPHIRQRCDCCTFRIHMGVLDAHIFQNSTEFSDACNGIGPRIWDLESRV